MWCAPVHDREGLCPSEEQVHFFRGERLAALGGTAGRLGVLEAERVLRQTIGLPPEDGEQLVPSDTPTKAPYRLAVGSRLDGPAQNSAFRNLADDRFNDWTLGFRMEVPIGQRDANSQLRRSRLLLSQRVIDLRNQEELVLFEVQRAFRDVVEAPLRRRRRFSSRLSLALTAARLIRSTRHGVTEETVALAGRKKCS